MIHTITSTTSLAPFLSDVCGTLQLIGMSLVILHEGTLIVLINHNDQKIQTYDFYTVIPHNKLRGGFSPKQLLRN
jgi:hypothetical protein